MRVGRGKYLLGREVARELIKYRAHDLKVRKLLRSDVREERGHLFVRHTEALVQIPHRRGKLTVGAAKLRYDSRRELRIGSLDLYGVL